MDADNSLIQEDDADNSLEWTDDEIDSTENYAYIGTSLSTVSVDINLK